jgi:signal peptidase I
MHRKIGLLCLLLFILTGSAFSSDSADQTTLGGYYLNTMTSRCMDPTINKADRIWSDPSYYKTHDISRGDIVAFRNIFTKQRLWVMRVIGLPGEFICIKSGVVYINGNPLREEYIIEHNNDKSQKFSDMKFHLQKNMVFVMGDNRDASNDSRFNGPVNISDIEAKVVGIYLSSQASKLGQFKSSQY